AMDERRKFRRGATDPYTRQVAVRQVLFARNACESRSSRRGPERTERRASVASTQRDSKCTPVFNTRKTGESSRPPARNYRNRVARRGRYRRIAEIAETTISGCAPDVTSVRRDPAPDSLSTKC